MANIFSALKPEAHLNHNIFDPSGRDVFSMKSAMIVPFSVIPTVPDATYRIQSLNLIEINGMPKSNFGRMSQYQEWFFVPYSQIWKHFETFYYQKLDNVRNPSNVLNPSLPTAVPTFDYYHVVNELFQAYYVQRFYLDMLSFVNRKDQCPFALQMSWEEALDRKFNANFTEYQDVHGRWCVEDMLRNFDMLGYGNLLPHFKKAFKSVILGSTSDYSLDVDFDDYYNNILTTLSTEQVEADFDSVITDLMSYNGQQAFDTFIGFNRQYHPNAWPILAYLKIWSDYFRSSQYDNTNYSYYYNLDWLTNPDINNEIDDDRIIEALKPRYHLYKRDLFTGLYPNSQFGDTAVANAEDSVFKILNTNIPSSNQSVAVASSGSSSVTEGSLFYTAGTDKWKLSPTPSISALAIRQAEAMQKYKEKILRAGNRLRDMQTALFGDSSRYLQDEYVERIGALDSPIQIDPVVATADSAASNLGDKGAKAHSVGNGFVSEYKSHDFGLIMGVMYILPEAEYENFGLDPINTFVESDDYFKADFQNLGLAPVTSIHFNIFDNHADTVLGYTSRYWQYKTRVSRVHGEFTEGGAFTDYVTPRSASDLVSSRLPALYASPNDIDRIFYTSEDSFQTSDHFKVNANVQVKAVLPMSITGLPY